MPQNPYTTNQFGNLAQAANPQVMDPNQNLNRQGAPNYARQGATSTAAQGGRTQGPMLWQPLPPGPQASLGGASTNMPGQAPRDKMPPPTYQDPYRGGINPGGRMSPTQAGAMDPAVYANDPNYNAYLRSLQAGGQQPPAAQAAPAQGGNASVGMPTSAAGAGQNPQLQAALLRAIMASAQGAPGSYGGYGYGAQPYGASGIYGRPAIGSLGIPPSVSAPLGGGYGSPAIGGYASPSLTGYGTSGAGK